MNELLVINSQQIDASPYSEFLSIKSNDKLICNLDTSSVHKSTSNHCLKYYDWSDKLSKFWETESIKEELSFQIRFLLAKLKSCKKKKKKINKDQYNFVTFPYKGVYIQGRGGAGGFCKSFVAQGIFF